MSDEIDIEEHDILENPLVRKIFPDLSVVKREIEHFDEATESKTNQEQGPHETNVLQDSNNVLKNITNHSTQAPYTNKIILGSKPSTSTLKTNHLNGNVIKIPKIVLQDLRLYLETSRRYCKDCLILFPRTSCFHLHKKLIHKKIALHKKNTTSITKKSSSKHKCEICGSYFYNGGNLRRHIHNVHSKKRTLKDKLQFEGETFQTHNSETNINTKSKLSLNENIKKKCLSVSEGSQKQFISSRKTIVSTLNQCVICGYCFSCKGNLHRHYKNVHKKKLKYSKFSNKINKNPNSKTNEINKSNKSVNPKTWPAQKQIATKNKSNFNIKCKECNLKFPSKISLQSHIKSCKKATLALKDKETRENTMKTLDIQKSEKAIPNITERQSIKEQFKLNINKCSICNTNTHSFDNLINHYSEIHNIKINKFETDSKKPLNKTSDEVCFHCKKTFQDSQSLIEHVYEHLASKNLKNKKDIYSGKSDCKTNVDDNIEIDNESYNDDDQDFDIDDKITDNEYSLNDASNDVQYNNGKDEVDTHDGPQNQDNKVSSSTKKRLNNPHKRDRSNEDDTNPSENNTDKTKNLFVCTICSYYLFNVRSFYRHMNEKHNTDTLIEIRREPFSSQCRYCPSTSLNVQCHNTHIHKYHKEKLYKKNISKSDYSLKDSDKTVSCALKSVVYKCLRCEIHFLSAETAKDHIGHMEFLINWKCHCQRIFKEIDSKMHLEQHRNFKNITVYEIDDNIFNTMLFKCTKCAVNFSEKRYFEHYPKCGDVSSSGKYCKVCDILIDDMEIENHQRQHEQNKNFSEFNIIECELIFNKNEMIKDIPKRKRNNDDDKIEITPMKRRYEQFYRLTYCPTCKCFLSYLALSRKAHIEERCTEIPKHICNLCGLMLTHKSLGVHRKYHELNKALCIQDFEFYDLEGNVINPPIPEYPKCSICHVHFTNKIAVRNHICNEIKYLECTICCIKLSESAHKLHMFYHSYFNKRVEEKSQSYAVDENSNKDEIERLFQDRSLLQCTDKTETIPKDVSIIEKSSTVLNTPNSPNDFGIFYSCKYCLIIFDDYDRLVEHCQSHYYYTCEGLPMPNDSNKCDVCSLQFDENAYNSHQNFHIRNESLKVLYVDLSYFKSSNNVWTKHVFRSLDKKTAKKIITRSIYRFEHRVRLKIFQKGPLELTLYKCYTCGNFIDPDIIYKHTGCNISKVRKFPCSFCGLPFISIQIRKNHESIHKKNPMINIKSYNIILFNKTEDKNYNNLVLRMADVFILYQCRNCHVIIERSDKTHDCGLNDLEKCPKCYLPFHKNDLDEHVEKHKIIMNYNSKNMKVILFGQKEQNENKDYLPTKFDGTIYDYTFYQCKKCDICIENASNIPKHVCFFDNANRIKCQICELYFSAKAYSHHVETHKSDPELSKENVNLAMFDLTDDKDNGEKQNNCQDDKIQNKVYDKMENEEDENINNVICNSSKDDEPNVFESVTILICKTCGLHFMNKSEVLKHDKNCDEKNKISKQSCKKCNLVFTATGLFSHLSSHSGDKLYKYYIGDVNRVDLQINSSDANIISVYKCSKCELHFVNEQQIYEHFSNCVGSSSNKNKTFECNKCKLIFETSLTSESHTDTCESQYDLITILKEQIMDKKTGI